jgi:two-component system nitrate/nitrite response regulator NarL
VTDTLRVLVADDHPLFLEGVITSLRGSPGIEIVAQAGDAAHAVRLAREHQPDIALLDVTMPGGGLTAASQIVSELPATKVVMLTVSEDEDDLVAAMAAGVSGYALKGVAAHELAEVLRSVHRGEAYVAPSLAWGLLRARSQPLGPEPFAELSPRERDVLGLVAAGLTNQEIGRRLGLAEKTVKHYMTGILSKLGATSRVEAALIAYKGGLGKEPDRGPVGASGA